MSSRLGLFSVTGDSTPLNNEAQNNLSNKPCLSFITSAALTVNRLLSFQQLGVGENLKPCHMLLHVAFDSKYCEGKSCTTAETASIRESPSESALILRFGNINRLSLSPSCPMLFCQRGQRRTAVLLTANNCQLAGFAQLLHRLHKCLTVVAQRGTTDHHTAVCGPHANASPS